MPNTPILRIAKAIIRNEQNMILTLKRTATAPRRPLTWDFPGGVMEKDELPEQTIIREVYEETGINVYGIEFIGAIGEYDEQQKRQTAEFMFYRCRAENTDITLSFEHSDFKWVSTDRFKQLNAPAYFKHIAEKL